MSDGADPVNPVLQTVLDGLNAGGYAAEVWDADWHLVGVTDEYRQMISLGHEPPDMGIGLHFLEPRMDVVRAAWPARPTRRGLVDWFRRWGGAMASASPGGSEAMREAVGDDLKPLVDAFEEQPMPPLISGRTEIAAGESRLATDVLMIPVRDRDGSYVGSTIIVKPAVGAATLAMLASGDVRLFERIVALVNPAQRPGAIMFGDLESSTGLARRLPSSAYFTLIQRLSLAADEVVVDGGGIVGKHVGDGVTAFFLSAEHDSDSGAARACIAAARAIGEATPALAAGIGLDPGDVAVRFGLHWGAGLYVGRLLTSGRLEVTALGDEVNEGARIESCASGGLRLASKPLIERLEPADAEALGIDPGSLVYTPLGELESSSEKARRDAPTISVCPV